MAVPGSAWAEVAELGRSPMCLGPGAHEGPAAVPVGQGSCFSPTGLSVQAEQGPALALLYLTSLLSEYIETYICKREVSGLVQGGFGFRV